MGQQIITQKQTETPDLEVFLSKYYPYFRYENKDCHGIMIKSGIVLTENESTPLFVKCYFKNAPNEEEKKITEFILNRMNEIKTTIEGDKKIDKKDVKEQQKNNFIFGVVPNAYIDNSDKAVLVIRQYLPNNLKERLNLMPYLTNIDKIWISFQLLFILNEMHSNGIYHGDLKMENILLTSNGSVYLCDIASYKPAYIQSDDITSYTYYFGTNKSINKSCFLAPERLKDKKEIEVFTAEELYEYNSAMDVFSAGAIIAELFSEVSLFDYSKILNHKKGEFNVKEALQTISNENIRNLIIRMIERDEKKRISIVTSLQNFGTEVCPITMTHFLIQYTYLINTSYYYWKPDMIIGGIYKHWRQIWKLLYGNEKCPILYQRLNFSILNKLILSPSFDKILLLQNIDNDDAAPLFKLTLFELYINVNDNSTLLNEKELLKKKDLFTRNSNQECAIILVNYITNSLRYSMYGSTKLVALEILKHFSQKFPDLYKIQNIIPYFVSVINEETNQIRMTSLHYLFDILYSIDYKTLILPSVDYRFFNQYIVKAIFNLFESKDLTLMLEFTNALDKIIEFEELFANVAIRSRFEQLNKLKLQLKSLNEMDNESKSQEVEKKLDEDKKELEEKIRTKTQDIFKKYDEQIENFKSDLFPMIEELISKNDEIDITLTLIRKLPSLLNFYGNKKRYEFSKFFITNFNKKGWIIQRETIRFIPQMMITLGEDTLEYFIIPCIEGLPSSNINEHVIYELISTSIKLLEMEFCTPLQTIHLFKSVLPFIIHPNYIIRNKILNFVSLLFRLMEPIDIFKYAYNDIEPYLQIPIANLTPDIIQHLIRKEIPRVEFQMALNDINLEEKLKEFNIDYPLLSDYIKKEISNRKLDNYSVDYFIINENFQYELDKCISSSTKYSIVDNIKKYYQKLYAKKIGDEKAVYQKFFGQLFWFADGLLSYTIPNIVSNENLNFKAENNSLISQTQFKLRYLFKVLNISLSLSRLNELLERSNQNNKLEIKNFLMNQNFSQWRPSGQLISTLHHQDKLSIEKLIAVDINKFASFDCEGGVIIWEINDNKDNTYHITKKWTFEPSISVPTPISYNKTICLIDNTNFVFASKNKLIKYSPQSSKALTSSGGVIHENKDGNDITCVISTGEKLQESQKIIFSNQNGKINIYDQRMSKVALSYNFPIENGMISCIANNDDKLLYVGTLGGFIMYYDERINTITKAYKYNDNTPIIGLSKYKPYKDKLRELDLYSLNLNQNKNNYLTIWTGAEDHEIALWNVDTLNCDILFKVNKMYGNDINSLTVEIPNINKEYGNSIDYYFPKDPLREKMSLLTQYTHVFTSNITKLKVMSNIKEEFYHNIPRRLKKMLNVYETSSTVQTVVSPLCEDYYNVQYFLSAGNDMTIRYWDISKEGLNSEDKRSFLVNAPCKISKCEFSKKCYDNTILLQSNETFNSKMQKKDMIGLSEYQNLNGIALHSMIQSEFKENVENNNLQYATRVADAAHKSVITDLLPMSFDKENFLVSSSWDGTVKVWK